MPETTSNTGSAGKKICRRPFLRQTFFFIGNFSEIPYEKTLREDAHAAVRKLSPDGDQRRRAKSASGLCSLIRHTWYRRFS